MFGASPLRVRVAANGPAIPDQAAGMLEEPVGQPSRSPAVPEPVRVVLQKLPIGAALLGPAPMRAVDRLARRRCVGQGRRGLTCRTVDPERCHKTGPKDIQVFISGRL